MADYHKIGEEFEDKGVKLQCIENKKNTCFIGQTECFYLPDHRERACLLQECASGVRIDKKSVIFVKK